MSTPHNEAKLGEIAKTVIMPGDPLRAKYIAENFMDNIKLVNQIRGMYAYTGTYQGKDLTIMASGMGMPSMGIYSFELYQFYQVENIIRIGSCGSFKPELKLFDIILSEQVFSEGNYALTFNNDNCHVIAASQTLNKIIQESAKSNSSNIYCGNTVCLDVFDPYVPDFELLWKRIPHNFNPYASEMEAFSLFYNAYYFHKHAACLMSVVDSKYIQQIATPEERQTGLNTMIQLALDTSVKL